jgi:hypothetical protein
MIEIWKPVVGYEGLYEISSMGRLKSLSKRWFSGTGRECFHDGMIMSLTKSPEGYPQARLRKNKIAITHRIHRLVADAFILNPLQYRCVNHIDSNRENNAVENLEWATHQTNRMHALTNGFALRGDKNPLTKLKDADILIIAFESDGKTNRHLAKQYGVSEGLISMIKNRRYKRLQNLTNVKL